MFYNYVTFGRRYLHSGEILYNYIKKEKPDLKYKHITTLDNLDLKQDDYLYYYFTAEGYDLSDPIIGRDPKLIKYFNKIQQYKDFNEFMPISWLVNKNNIINEIIKRFKNNNKLYLTLNDHRSGGGTAAFILNKNNNKELYNIYKIIKETNDEARLSEYINIKKNLAVHLIFFKDNFLVTDIINQYIYKNVRYRGNFYPNNLTTDEDTLIRELINKIGNKFLKMNVVGIIGLDLMLSDDNKVYLTEINPQKMGSSICINAMSDLTYNMPIPYLEYLSCSNINYSNISLNINKDTDIKWSFVYLYNTTKISKKYKVIDVKDFYKYFNDTYNNGTKHEVYFKDTYNNKEFYFRLKTELIK